MVVRQAWRMSTGRKAAAQARNHPWSSQIWLEGEAAWDLVARLAWQPRWHDGGEASEQSILGALDWRVRQCRFGYVRPWPNERSR